MNLNHFKQSTLKTLENCELAGITFIRGYIQFLFDGPILNAYTLPRVKTNEQMVRPKTPGYCDALCGQIGKTVVAAHEEPNEKIVLEFVDSTSIEISLKDEDRVGAEAVMLQTRSAGAWNVW